MQFLRVRVEGERVRHVGVPDPVGRDLRARPGVKLVEIYSNHAEWVSVTRGSSGRICSSAAGGELTRPPEPHGHGCGNPDDAEKDHPHRDTRIHGIRALDDGTADQT
jgi:hypothetical protein